MHNALPEKTNEKRKSLGSEWLVYDSNVQPIYLKLFLVKIYYTYYFQ